MGRLACLPACRSELAVKCSEAFGVLRRLNAWVMVQSLRCVRAQPVSQMHERSRSNLDRCKVLMLCRVGRYRSS